jgi:hypothetical protein
MEKYCPVCSLEKHKPQNKYCSMSCRNIYINSIKDYSKQSKKVSESLKLAGINKSGKLMEFSVTCNTCKCNIKVLEREKRFPMKHKYFCSRSCANARGPRSNEFKEKVKLKLNKEPYIICCKYCNSEFQTKVKSKTSCSLKCYQTYRKKLNFSNSPIKKMYKQAAIFRFSLNLYPSEFNFKLVEENGWYSAKNHGNNLNGVSRDHLFSVSEGFNQMINPLILAHPANCSLKIHTDNISKNSKCSITLDQLLDKINSWNIKYCETFSVNKVFITNKELEEILLTL